MKSSKLQRGLAIILLLALGMTAVLGSSALAYARRDYRSRDPYYYDYDYYRDYYKDGFISVYPVSGHYGYGKYYDNPYHYGS